jgi:hypothetical protein
MGRTVNPLSFDFRGSTPLLPTSPADPPAGGKGGQIRVKFFFNWEISFWLIGSLKCGSSSVGRATAFQAVGRGFEPRLPLSRC